MLQNYVGTIHGMTGELARLAAGLSLSPPVSINSHLAIAASLGGRCRSTAPRTLQRYASPRAYRTADRGVWADNPRLCSTRAVVLAPNGLSSVASKARVVAPSEAWKAREL